MVISVFGIDQSGNNNNVKIDDSTRVRLHEETNITVAPSGGAMDTQATHERAIRNGRAFTASAQSEVNRGAFLNVYFQNPVDSGYNAAFIARKMQSTRTAEDTPLPYAFMFAPIIPDTAETITSGNRLTGGPASSMLVSFERSLRRPESDPVQPYAPSGYVPTNGNILNIDDDASGISRIVTPGYSFAITFGATGSGATNDIARLVMTWLEEAVT